MSQNNYSPNSLSSRCGNVSVIIISSVLVVGLLAGSIFFFLRSGNDQMTEVLTAEVRRGQFVHYVSEKGEIESSNNVEIRCEVKARNSTGTAILEVVPEGTVVNEGDLLVKLDASALEQELIQQQIKCNTSEAIMIQARNNYSAAVISKREYLEGAFIQQEQEIQSEIFVAEETLRRAQQYALYSERLAARGYVTALQLEGDRFAVAKAENELDSARTRLRVLQEISKEKNVTQLDADIAITEARWKAEESSYQLEQDELQDIRVQIVNCEIYAPQAGEVVYANKSDHRGGNDFVVEPGVMVRERQTIIRLPDATQMQVKASINETLIEDVRPGMSAIITVEAIEGVVMHGKVTRVDEYPEPSHWMSGNIKTYAAYILIDEADEGLKPGLTASVQILAEILEDAQQLPISAIYEHSPGYHYCVVMTNGGWETRRIALGSGNDQYVVIREGESTDQAEFDSLSEGDLVALSPRQLIDLSLLPKIENQPIAIQTQPSPAGRTEQVRENPRQRPENSTVDQVTAMADQMFSMLDGDKDGMIREDEFPSGPRRAELAAADTNGDGAVDKQELLARLKQLSAGQGGRSSGARS